MKRILIPLLALAMLAGCKTVTTTPATAPTLTGACNAADSAMFQTLVFAQGSILNLKATLADPQTAPKTVTTLTPYYNQAKTDYDIAIAAWKGYHAACILNPSLSPATAQSSVNKLNTDIQSTPKVTP